jgi:hypothetical protein
MQTRISDKGSLALTEFCRVRARLRPMQWTVTVTDNHGQDWLFIVSAGGEREAIDTGRKFFQRQAPRGTYATAASAKKGS